MAAEAQKPRIGTMAVGLNTYWAQFPGMREHLAQKHEEFVTKIGDRAQVVGAGLVDTVEGSVAAGRRFIEADVDVVFVQAMTYSTSDNMLPAVKDLDVPVILFNIQEEKVLDFANVKTLDGWLGHGCTCAGVPELSAMLIRYGLQFDVVTGYLNGDEDVDLAIDKWCRASAVRRRMRSSAIGLLGRQFHGMMDLYIDENTLMKQFSMMTSFLMWEDVLAYAQQASAAEISAGVAKLREVFEIPDTISQEELESVSAMYVGYMRLAEEKNLSVLANHFERNTVGREEEMIAALNPAHTLMLRDGIACAVEGDIRGALAMMILKTVGGSANLGELYTMDFHDDVVIVGHSGASDPCIADQKPILRTTNVFHGKSGKGFTTQVVPRTGPITLLALTTKADGGFKMVVAEGMVEDGPILELGDTNCRVRFPMPMRAFVNRWCLTGPSHHGAIGSGSHADTLESVAKILKIDIEVITRNH